MTDHVDATGSLYRGPGVEACVCVEASSVDGRRLHGKQPSILAQLLCCKRSLPNWSDGVGRHARHKGCLSAGTGENKGPMRV